MNHTHTPNKQTNKQVNNNLLTLTIVYSPYLSSWFNFNFPAQITYILKRANARLFSQQIGFVFLLVANGLFYHWDGVYKNYTINEKREREAKKKTFDY